MTDLNDARKEGYWQRVSEATQTTVDMIEAAIEAAEDDPEDVMAVTITGEADGMIFGLCHSIKERDGHEILTLRYVAWPEGTADPEDVRVTTNRLRIRIQGTVPEALKVLSAMFANDHLGGDDPQLLDARNGGLSYDPEELTRTLGEMPSNTVETEDEDEEQGADEEDLPDGTVRCARCEETVPEEEAVNFGGGDLGDMWIHSGGCE